MELPVALPEKAGQTVHAPLPPEEYVPPEQFKGTADPLGQYLPATHVKQLSALLLPMAVLYVPAEQLVPDVLPCPQYAPARHKLQLLEAEADAKVPAVQLIQTVEPMDGA